MNFMGRGKILIVIALFFMGFVSVSGVDYDRDLSGVDFSGGVSGDDTILEESCSLGCESSFLGNGVCDEECNNLECSWDEGDCEEDASGGDWGDMDTNNDILNEDSIEVSGIKDDAITDVASSGESDVSVSQKSSDSKYTLNFYIALVACLIFFLIILYIIYSLIRGYDLIKGV